MNAKRVSFCEESLPNVVETSVLIKYLFILVACANKLPLKQLFTDLLSHFLCL